MAAPQPIPLPERALVHIRRVQEALRVLIREDQDKPEMAASVCEALSRIEEQVDQVAGLQELFEWYSRMP